MNGTNGTSENSSLRQVIITLFYLLIYPVLLFFLSGDWCWAESWSFSIVLYLYFKDPALFNERFGSPFQKERKMWDKILLVFMMFGSLKWFVLMPPGANEVRHYLVKAGQFLFVLNR